MQLNEKQRQILIGILQDQRRLASETSDSWRGLSRQELGRHRLRAQYARQGMVPLALEAWLGYPPGNADHVLCHRACVALEDMGLLVRCNPLGGRRTTHLKLTEAGLCMAKELCAQEYGPDGLNIEQDIDWAGFQKEMGLMEYDGDGHNAQ